MSRDSHLDCDSEAANCNKQSVEAASPSTSHSVQGNSLLTIQIQATGQSQQCGSISQPTTTYSNAPIQPNNQV